MAEIQPCALPLPVRGLLCELKNLRELKLHNNQLRSIPDDLGNLSQLRALFINHNELDALPPSLGTAWNLSQIMLDGNSLPEAVEASARRGVSSLLSYLRSLLAETRPLFEAKLVLVGEGGVGKTSLIAALNDLEFVEGRETTHGIEMCALQLPHPRSQDTILLNVWDFGGQPVYRITHQFFYSRRSLYLLLWSPRRGAESCDVEGWIRRIRLRVGEEARILVVSTHSETGDRVARIDERTLCRDYGSIIVGFHEVDSKTGAGIKELRAILAEQAS